MSVVILGHCGAKWTKPEIPGIQENKLEEVLETFKANHENLSTSAAPYYKYDFNNGRLYPHSRSILMPLNLINQSFSDQNVTKRRTSSKA